MLYVEGVVVYGWGFWVRGWMLLCRLLVVIWWNSGRKFFGSLWVNLLFS